MHISAFGRALAPIALLILAACGGDATGPKTDISGQWTYSATNLASGSISCNIGGERLTLTQSGNTFTGSTSGGFISCTGPGGTSGSNLSNDVVANGQINGNSVQFDIGTQDIHNVGTLSGNSISGTVTVHLIVSGSTVVLSGNFTAVR